MAPTDGGDNVRADPFTHRLVHVVGSRQSRPNLPPSGCPFCVGGLEAPEPYDVRTFVNRWPAMDGERCEMVLFTSDHDATFWSLGVEGARRVIDVWAERTKALGARDDVDHVLIFENRGPEVGATISHPHGQIYAYDHVPERPRRRLESFWHPDEQPDQRLVATHGDMVAFVPWAPAFPVAVDVAPRSRVPDLPSLGPAGRDDLARTLIDVLERLDRLFGEPLPYMLWINQRPTTDTGEVTAAALDAAWLNIEIVSPFRSPGVQRYVASAEVACEEYFNPVVPEELAERLRDLA
jgi:UDPglucose--hexose-1-phosphate uridylyltransferase